MPPGRPEQVKCLGSGVPMYAFVQKRALCSYL